MLTNGDEECSCWNWWLFDDRHSVIGLEENLRRKITCCAVAEAAAYLFTACILTALFKSHSHVSAKPQ